MWCNAYKVKPSKRDACPSLVMAVGIEGVRPAVGSAEWGEPSVFGRATLCISRRSRGRWGPVREVHCDTPDEVWTAAEVAMQGHRRMYVVSPNALDDLTLLGFWDRVETEHGEFPKGVKDGQRVLVLAPKDGQLSSFPLIFGDRCDILGFGLGHGVVRWVSVTNWADLSLHDLAQHLQYPLPHQAGEFDKWRAHGWPATDQARLIVKYVTGAMDWWVENGCGMWKDTPGAAAWATFRRRCHASGLIRHEHVPSLILEDRACFGGRASAWYVGPVGYPERWPELSGAPTPRPTTSRLLSRIHRYDVSAMYPTLLRDREFPVKLIDWTDSISLHKLGLWMEGSLVVAAVRVRTKRPEYPLRSEKGPVYPVGQFDTVLTTPQLREAMRRGELIRCYEAALYKAGRPFRIWASWALSLRTDAKRAEDPARELYIKTMSNALGGRLGRVPINWTDTPHIPPDEWWGRWIDAGDLSGDPITYRGVAGRVQRLDADDHRPGTMGACFAHLTAYGREMMTAIRERMPAGTVIWQDTDALWVTDAGKYHLERLPEYKEGAYGFLRYETTATDAQFTTPKHYWYDGNWVLAGISTGFGIDSAGNAAELLTANPVRRLEPPAIPATYQYLQRIDLDAIEPGVRVGEDGWVHPPKVWVGERPPPSVPPEAPESPWWADPHEQRQYLPYDEPPP